LKPNLTFFVDDELVNKTKNLVSLRKAEARFTIVELK
jgi:hypothetical protein